MTFPGAHAHVYYNEAGEPLGWDYPAYDEPPYVDEELVMQRQDDWEWAYDQAYDESYPDEPTDEQVQAAYNELLAWRKEQ